MARILRSFRRWSVDRRTTLMWRVSWALLCLLGVLGPLAYLIALSDVRVAPLGGSLERVRVLRARPLGPDSDPEVGSSHAGHPQSTATVDAGAPVVVAAPARGAADAPGHGDEPARRPLPPDLARSPPIA